jgi:hypothetical protein
VQARLARSVALGLVPAVALMRAALDPGWTAAGPDGITGLAVFLVAAAFAVTGAGWTWRVTRTPAFHGPVTRTAYAHLVRSLEAAEEFAVRLAAGAPPPQAWRLVAARHHFAVSAAPPAATADAAIEVAARLRLQLHRRQAPAGGQVGRRVLAPMGCVLAAVVLLLILG